MGELYKRGDKVVFGMYRGGTIEEVIHRDPGYVRWALRDYQGFALTPDLHAELDEVSPEPKVEAMEPVVAVDEGEEDSQAAAEVAEILDGLKDSQPEWLLITAQHDLPCEDTKHESRDALLGDLANALATRSAVIGIFHRGEEVSQVEHSQLVSEAKEQLGPISRFKADGGFF